MERNVDASACDRCHEQPGAGFLDRFWICEGCAREYAAQLEIERRPPRPRWIAAEGRWWKR